MNRQRSPAPLALAFLVTTSALAGDAGQPQASSHFEPPVRLQADAKVIDTGPAWGHSSPAVTDLNGDGLDDLVVGDFSGKFRYYLNVGKPNAPVYSGGRFIQAGGAEAEVHIYCCIGAQARFRDLDGDGIRDLIANSYDPGHCYLFRGRPGNTFAAREELLDKSGVPVRSVPVPQQDYQSFGSFYEAVDWDADGDLDLLIGCFTGELKVRINEGTAKDPRFATDNVAVHVAGEAMLVNGHLCPVVADWDGDGLWDVVAGCDDGSVTWFRNVGKKGAPSLAAGHVLVKPYNAERATPVWTPDDAIPGRRTQVEVTDHNGDGKLDLLLGDFYTAYPFKPGLTDAQKQTVKDMIAANRARGQAYAAKMKALQADFAKRFPDDQAYSDQARKEWSAGYQALRNSLEAKRLEAEEKEFNDKLRPFLVPDAGAGDRSGDASKAHGHVWLFIRK